MSAQLGTLLGLATTSHGILRRPDATAAGYSAKRLRTLVANGLLEPVGARGFRVVGSQATARQQVLAACVEVGGAATVTTSSALHGIDGFLLTDPIEVVIREGKRSHRSRRALIHTTRYLTHDHLVVVDGIPTLNVARTLLSLAAVVPRVPEPKVVAAIEDAMRKGLATEAWLRWTLDDVRRRGRSGISIFERALDRACQVPVTESWLETEVCHILRAAGLPLPEVQVRIAPNGDFVARVDFQYPGTTAIIEANGHGSHATREQLRRDAKRRRQLAALGLTVYDFTYDELVETPEELVATVRRILGLDAVGDRRPTP